MRALSSWRAAGQPVGVAMCRWRCAAGGAADGDCNRKLERVGSGELVCIRPASSIEADGRSRVRSCVAESHICGAGDEKLAAPKVYVTTTYLVVTAAAAAARRTESATGSREGRERGASA